MLYSVAITETLERVLKLEAESESEAIEKARDMYDDGDVILTASDYIDVNYDVIDSE